MTVHEPSRLPGADAAVSAPLAGGFGPASSAPVEEGAEELLVRLEALLASEGALAVRGRLPLADAVALDALAFDCARGGGAFELAVGDGLDLLARTGGDVRLGYSGVGDLARERLGLSAAQARRLRRNAAALRSRPLLRAAVLAGTVSPRKAEVVLPLARGADEAYWVEKARTETLRRLEAAAFAPEHAEGDWRRVRLGLPPGQAHVLDVALEVAKLSLGPAAPLWRQLWALAAEFLSEYPIDPLGPARWRGPARAAAAAAPSIMRAVELERAPILGHVLLEAKKGTELHVSATGVDLAGAPGRAPEREERRTAAGAGQSTPYEVIASEEAHACGEAHPCGEAHACGEAHPCGEAHACGKRTAGGVRGDGLARRPGPAAVAVPRDAEPAGAATAKELGVSTAGGMPAARDALGAADPYAVLARLERLVAERASADEHLGRACRLVKELGVPRRLGYACFEAWCAERLGIAPSTVYQRVALERRMAELPELRDALRSRRLSLEQVRLVARFATRGDVAGRIAAAAGKPCIALAREGEAEDRLQMRNAGELRAVLPEEAEELLGDAIRSARLHARRPLTPGEALVEIGLHFVFTWKDEVMRLVGAADPVVLRDGGLCTVPGCSRAADHVHHVRFRSAGGPCEPWNETSLCAVHHLRGVHAGNVAISGAAPDGLAFALGERAVRAVRA